MGLVFRRIGLLSLQLKMMGTKLCWLSNTINFVQNGTTSHPEEGINPGSLAVRPKQHCWALVQLRPQAPQVTLGICSPGATSHTQLQGLLALHCQCGWSLTDPWPQLKLFVLLQTCKALKCHSLSDLNSVAPENAAHKCCPAACPPEWMECSPAGSNSWTAPHKVQSWCFAHSLRTILSFTGLVWAVKRTQEPLWFSEHTSPSAVNRYSVAQTYFR